MSEPPSVLVPYPGASPNPHTQDIFLFMRPETNGVLGEKAILKTIGTCEEYKKKIRLVYMANISSESLISDHVYEQYYALRIHFATRGNEIFTPYMKDAFSAHYNSDFKSSYVIGAFDALREFDMIPKELFNIRVPKEDTCVINGQVITKYQDAFIVNYDIPEMLHLRSLKYDIAAMCFRMDLPYEYFYSLIAKMKESLIAEGVTSTHDTTWSAFHYSRGPFDQIRDGASFLFAPNGQKVPLKDISFVHYLQQKGVGLSTITHLTVNPIVTIAEDSSADSQEVSIVEYTRGKSYESAYHTLNSVLAHSCIDPLLY